MKSILTILFLSVVLSVDAQDVVNGTLMHDGLERDYILYIPVTYEPGNPLVMNFHGYGSNSFEQLFYGDFQSIADEAGFLLVVPNGTIDNTGTSHWNVGWGTSTVDDVGFISALIDSLHTDYSINLDRVYSTGMSNGGFISYVLACELSEKIAAIASVTGTMNINSFQTCNSQHPMPVMEIHGTEDGTVLYEGAFWIEGTEDVVSYWAEFNGISSPPMITPVDDIDPNDGCTAEHWVYQGGTNGVGVELFKIINGGHTWPGASFVFATTNQDFSASEEIWRFFSQYDINGIIIQSEIEEIEESVIHLWPNPGSGLLNLNWEKGSTDFAIVNQMGRLILQGNLSQGSNEINLEHVESGLYFMVINDSVTRIVLL